MERSVRTGGAQFIRRPSDTDRCNYHIHRGLPRIPLPAKSELEPPDDIPLVNLSVSISDCCRRDARVVPSLDAAPPRRWRDRSAAGPFHYRKLRSLIGSPRRAHAERRWARRELRVSYFEQNCPHGHFKLIEVLCITPQCRIQCENALVLRAR